METTLPVSNQEEYAEPLSGSCFIVGAPIEERDDITQRGIRTLQTADLVVTSNEQYAASLLKRFALSKKLLGISEEIADDVIDMVRSKLREGKRIVILSDPSFRFSNSLSHLIQTIRQAGLEPRVVPGVDLIATALAMSGFDSQCYAVVGAIPTRREARVAFAELLVERTETLVLPGGMARILPSLATLADVMPEREAVLVLRPTVPGEKILRGQLRPIYEGFIGKKFQGDFVVILAPLVTEEEEFEEIETNIVAPKIQDHESEAIEAPLLPSEVTDQQKEESEPEYYQERKSEI